MVPSDIIPSVMNYADSCTALKAAPACEQVRMGVIPLDSLPAAWWNCMWYDTNRAVNCARYGLTSIIQEINSVLAAAGKQVDQCCVNQLYESIETIRQTIGNSICAGAVKSSSASGQISINGTTGIMTANGVGNAALLTTSSHTVTNAINELKQVYAGCFSTLATNTDTMDNIKANTDHAVTATSYGVGNAADYGHLKISDVYNADLGLSGVAASQKAVSDMYDYFFSMTGGARACTCCAYNDVTYISCNRGSWGDKMLLVSNVSGYTSVEGLSSIIINGYDQFPENSITYQYLQGSNFDSSCIRCIQVRYCGTCNFSCCEYNGCLCGVPYGHNFHWGKALAGANVQLVDGSSRSCITQNSLELFHQGPAILDWAGCCNAWCMRMLNNPPNCDCQSVLYGGFEWKAQPSCPTYDFGCAYRTCKTGSMVYTFWNSFILSDMIGQTATWKLNGCPLQFCACICAYCFGGVPGASGSCRFAQYYVRGERGGCNTGCITHVHFNVYMQPLYTFNPQNYSGVNTGNICRVSAYLGTSLTSRNATNMCKGLTGLAVLASYCSGYYNPFGGHMHHFYNYGCSTNQWILCARAALNCRCISNVCCCFLGNGAQNSLYNCYGRTTQPPIYQFYIEE